MSRLRIGRCLLLLGPAVAWLGWVGSCAVGRAGVDSRLLPVDGLSWGTGPDRLDVELQHRNRGTTEEYTIAIRRSDGSSAYTRRLTILSELPWGQGTVAAVQADEDPELEIAVWGSVRRLAAGDGSSGASDRPVLGAFFLDNNDGRVQERPIDELSSEAAMLVETWGHYHNRRPTQAAMVLVLLLVPCYLILAAVAVVRAWLRSSRESRAS